ncbi:MULTISPECIES: APC family permease [Thermoanaerobacterium]|uniref:Amino acid permease n=2 Tax=Thermoanaerobacterium TaxID=28895 RepID=W9EBR6_9THEO|nr:MULTISPECIES: APC family permease [Thermoanaerobacterium]AFK87265.1 amino acid permease-associated region [Thermoanaerobacterium saccharolyticum JW/SL-YS485]ETO39563.1 amino acid permease [Thermoanaerobacterium aotearoense SCUT27]WHE06406.1 APC family permease [Thermoanaerobacterium thermosaccharolyticum]
MNNKSDSTLENFGYKQELKRALSVWDLIIYGLIFMVPIAPFGIYGFVADISKGMVALAYLIGIIGMIFTAFSYASMSEAFPIAGSVYSYATNGLNKVIGFFTGWAILLDYLLVPALLYVVSAAALSSIFPVIPVVVWALIFIIINTIINILGIEFTAKFNKIVLILELIVLALFIVVGIVAISQGVGGAQFSFKAFYDPQNFSLGLVMSAVSIAVLSFLGFDGISTLAEETVGGKKTVGRATVLALLFAGALFILQTWVASMIWPDYKSFSDLNTAFYDVAKRAGGTWLMLTTSLSTAFAWGIANSLAAQAAVSRVLFSMARDKNLPSFLSKVHPKYKTPYIATIFMAVLSAVLVIIYSNKIADLTSVINFGALTSFLVLHITVIVHFIKNKSLNIWKHIVSPVLGFLVIFYVWINLNNHAKILGASWIGIGIIYYIILKFVFKKKVENLDV